jgi:hypothetical protein
MIKWFATLLDIVKNYDSLRAEVYSNQKCCNWLNDKIDETEKAVDRHIDSIQYQVTEAVQTIKDRTELHVDVNPSTRGDPHQIIMIGNYRGRDYIQTFSVHPEEFRELVHRFTDMQKYAHRGRIDAVPEMKAIINEESMKWWKE